MWVDFTRLYDGLTHSHLEDVEPAAVIEPGRHIVVGDYDADPAVAQVVDVTANGVVLLRVLPVHARLQTPMRSTVSGSAIGYTTVQKKVSGPTLVGRSALAKQSAACP